MDLHETRTATFEDIFVSEKIESPEYYLIGFDFEQLLFYATSILSINISDLKRGANIPYFNLELLLPRFGVSLEDSWLIISRINTHSERLSILRPNSSLRLLEVILSLPFKQKLQSKPLGYNMLKAYLAINQDLSSKYYLSKPSMLNSEFPFLVNLNFYSLLNVARFSHFNFYEILIPNIIKSHFFLKFVRENYKLQQHNLIFMLKYKCADWDEYLFKYLEFINLLTPDFKSNTEDSFEKPQKIHIPQHHSDFENLCIFFDQLVFSNYSLEDSNDFSVLRDRPLWRFEKGIYSVLFVPFAVEKLYKSLYFEFSKINEVVSDKIKNFRSYIGFEFSERFLFESVLNIIFRENKAVKYFAKSDRDFLELNIEAAPDYYVRKTNKILLFENKDNLIKGNVVDSMDFESIVKEFETRIKKAIKQLTSCINKCVDGHYETYKKDRNVIFPILIAHDNIFVTPGLNLMANKWFSESVTKLDTGGFTVKPLTIITLDFIIDNSDLLRNNRIDLYSLISDYHNFVYKKNKSGQINKECYSFHHYTKGIVWKERIQHKSVAHIVTLLKLFKLY